MDIHKVCRACLATKEDFLNLFTTSTSEMFTFCTTVKVSLSDSLPKVLCRTCFDLLDKLFLFKQQCIASNKTLQSCVKICDDIKPNIEGDVDIAKNDIKIEIPDTFTIQPGLSDSEINISENIFSTNSNYECNDPGGIMYQEADLSMRDEKTIPTTEIKKRKKFRNATQSKEKWKKKLLKERKVIHLNYPCLQCNKKFSFPERLESHIKTHEGMKDEILCNICNKTFKQWHGLRNHKEFVHNITEKTLECPTCGKLFKTSMTLRNHQKLHQERKDFVCHICGGSFKSVGGLQNHVDTHTENRQKNYECKICGKKFVSSSYLTSHMFRHKDRRFVCATCRFPFFTKADLTRHMLIHKGIKPYVCEICNKSYSTKSFLREHGRMHSGERPFSCDYCSMNFISKRRLIDHRRTHTGEKPHKCDKCNQAFIQRGSLTRHMKVHEK